jgi:predicted permease
MPVLAAVIVVSLGVGIGVNTVVFSWLQARILHPLPGVSRSATLKGIEPRTDRGMYPSTSWLEYRDLRARLTAFESLIAFRMAPLYLGSVGTVERAYGLFVSDNYFSALGVRPALGRFFRPDEVSRPGTEPVAVISHGLWTSRYGRSPDAVGRTIRVNGRDLAIVGVAPDDFQGTVLGLSFEVWVPATIAPLLTAGTAELEDRRVRGYLMLARLRDDVQLRDAQAELEAAMRELAQAYPATNTNVTGEILAFWELPRGPQRMMAIALVVLQGLMLLLLLAVCGNTANLVLARASARQQEVGIRLALGASPSRVARLLLGETIVMASFGGLLGAALAVWWTPALVTLPLSGLPVKFTTPIDAGAVAFAVLLGIACGVVIGALPALQLSRVDPLAALRAGAKNAGRSTLRNALMGVQVALAAIVLIVAGLFFRNFMETKETDPGFRREGVLLGAYDLAGRNMAAPDIKAFPARLLEALRQAPGVEGAAIATNVPLDIHGMPLRSFVVEGHARTDGGMDQAVNNVVTPGYFELMGIPLVAGTGFAPLTDNAAPPQAIVNEEFVARYLAGREPIGRRLRARSRDHVIAGVARNSLYNAFGEPPTPAIYLSYRDNAVAVGEIHVRTTPGAEKNVTADVRRAVSGLDPELPVFNVRTLDEHVETNLVFRRVPARLFMVLGPMLLVLASLGIYAVVAYSVSLRTMEIGIRLAVGATAQRVVAGVVAENLRVILAGTVIGWMIAFVAAQELVGGRFMSLPVFVGVPAVLLLVSAFAIWLPARRAARLDPVRALREMP